MLKIGEFYTTCSSGYWQLIELKPKFAEDDYNGATASWKKGDRLGDWAIMKKAFTPRMKPRIDFEYIDSSWLKPVSDDEAAAIRQAFEADGKLRAKYEAAQVKLPPNVGSCWMDLPEDQVDAFRECIAGLPERFTMKELWERGADFKQFRSFAPAGYILYCMNLPWDMDEAFDLIYTSCELRRAER